MTWSGRRAIKWTNEGLNAAGDVLGTSLIAALKVGLVLVFVWYVVALIDAAPGVMGKAVVIGPMGILLVIPAWTFFTAERTSNERDATFSQRGGIGRYLLLVTVPIVVVGVLSSVYRRLHPELSLFSTPLLHETETALNACWKQIWP